MPKTINKTDRLNIRISEKDKEAVRILAEKNQMTISEYIVYLIRREADKL